MDTNRVPSNEEMRVGIYKQYTLVVSPIQDVGFIPIMSSNIETFQFPLVNLTNTRLGYNSLGLKGTWIYEHTS